MMKKFRHNKTGKEYELIQDSILFKDFGLMIAFDDEDVDGGGIFPDYNADKLEWRNNLVLYKALYENPDGPYFVRHAEDFFENFTEIPPARELHFYTNLCNEEQTSEWDLDTMQVDFVNARKAIYEGNERIVKTTVLTFLGDTWDLIDDGWRVFIHNDNVVMEIKEGMVTPNGKEIRRGHNLHRMLVASALGEIK